MYSYQRFTPGSSANTSRMINYVAEYNAANSNNVPIPCVCIPNRYDKNTPGSYSPSARVSYATKIVQIIQATKGGKVEYGNFYLGKPLNINYLGRIEGMPGGSGMPPINRF